MSNISMESKSRNFEVMLVHIKLPKKSIAPQNQSSLLQNLSVFLKRRHTINPISRKAILSDNDVGIQAKHRYFTISMRITLVSLSKCVPAKK
ncbi:MAG: hypothetical protein IJM14_08715 [Lachnospiraceae bacterium]|nr:hypothetical protein [Lachnospiraceae bacterium]